MDKNSSRRPKSGHEDIPQDPGSPSQEVEISERMAIVEEAIRLQIATGASHLQQLEMAPEAFGLSASARAPVRRFRQRRNGALHSVATTEEGKGFKKEGRPGQVVKLLAPHGGGGKTSFGLKNTPRRRPQQCSSAWWRSVMPRGTFNYLSAAQPRALRSVIALLRNALSQH